MASDEGLSRDESRQMRDIGRQAMSQVVGVALKQAVSHDLLRTFAVVSKVNGDGTVDLECGSEETPMPLNGVRLTLGCSTVEVGDTVVVDTYDHSPLVVSVLYSNASSGHTVASKPAVDKASEAAASAKEASDAATESAKTAQAKADAATESAATAQSTADAANTAASKAQSTADGLATMIRQDADGITVGKSADGKTYATGRTRMTADAFQVLDKAGTVITQMAKDGASFLAGLVRIVVGTITLPGNKTTNFISVKAASGVAGLSGIISRLDAAIDGITSSMSAGWEQDFGYGVTAITRRSNAISSAAYLAPDKAELHVVDNHVTMTPTGFSVSNKAAARAALGITLPVPVSNGGTGATSIDAARRNLHISQGSKVCTGHGTPWVTLFGSWSEFQQATGCYDSGLPTLVTMNGDWSAFDGPLSGCEICGGRAVYVMAQTQNGIPNISSTQSLRINWICIW